MSSKMSVKDRQRRLRTLFLAQGGLCAFCWKPMQHPDDAREERGNSTALRPEDPTLEHVVPASRKGSNALGNLLLTHQLCNARRGNRKLPAVAQNMRRRVLGWLEQHYGRVPQAEENRA